MMTSLASLQGEKALLQGNEESTEVIEVIERRIKETEAKLQRCNHSPLQHWLLAPELQWQSRGTLHVDFDWDLPYCGRARQASTSRATAAHIPQRMVQVSRDRSTPDNNPAYVLYGDYCRVL
jgi:hypothetical protein